MIMVMKRIRVRFNLGKGKNFMKWKVEFPDKRVQYFDPTTTQLVMFGCQLRNYKKVAEKIYNGANKTVCAWVLCEDIDIRTERFIPFDANCDRIRYNPRIKPNWLLNDEVADDQRLDMIGSVDYGLYNLM
jgi:hypothetical protein